MKPAIRSPRDGSPIDPMPGSSWATTQCKRQCIGYDTGTDPDDPGYFYAIGPASTLDNSLPTVQHLPNGQVRRMCPLSTDNTLSVPVLNYVDDDTVQRLKLPQFDQLTGQPADYEVLLNRMAASMKNTKYHPVAVRLKDKLIASGNLPTPETCLLSTFVPRQSAISRAAQQLSQSAATKARRVGHCIGFANLLTVAVLCGTI